MVSQPTTLLTGVPGWLGSQLYEVLANQQDRRVRLLVHPAFRAGVPANASVVVANAARDDLSRAVTGVDTVFHLAGVIHPRSVRGFYDVNFEGTRRLAEAAAKASVRRFILISSNAVAGFNTDAEHLFGEYDAPNPYRHYGRSKLLAEESVKHACIGSDMRYTIIRPCWFYGPHQPARQTRFFKMIQSGRPLVFGKGDNLRSMSYIDNTIQALLLAESRLEAENETFWIADERPYQTLEIYETIAEILGIKLTPRFLPSLIPFGCRIVDALLQSIGLYQQEIHVAGEMDQHIACSIEKAKRVLGYRPAISLREGMKRSVAWCRNKGYL